jgi:hypothetical protein
MTVMGANPGHRRYRRNGIGSAMIAGATGALVSHALQPNPGPSFVLIEKDTGLVVYTKRATGMGNAAITACAMAGRRLAARTGKTYTIFLDIRGLRRGMTVNVPMVYALGITEEVGPEGIQPNPHLEGSPCPTCSGSLAYQGTLGQREHYRCRDCGIDVNTPITHRRRYRGWRATCAHGEITNRCELCRGRRVSSRIKMCPHGISGGGPRCVRCQDYFRRGTPVQSNPAIRSEWDRLTGRKRLAVLEFAGIPYQDAKYLASRTWELLPGYARIELEKGWRDTSSRSGGTTVRRMVPAMNPQANPGPRGARKMTITVEQFADWVKKKRDPKMWKAFLAKFKGYEKWTHGARARKVQLEWVETPGVDGLWITYDGGKQPESTYIMPKGSPRKGAWKHPWDTMPDIKHDPQAGIVLTKLRGRSKITDFYHK